VSDVKVSRMRGIFQLEIRALKCCTRELNFQ
jgi:hypothetical protein